jgi:hypothetical protein
MRRAGTQAAAGIQRSGDTPGILTAAAPPGVVRAVRAQVPNGAAT